MKSCKYVSQGPALSILSGIHAPAFIFALLCLPFCHMSTSIFILLVYVLMYQHSISSNAILCVESLKIGVLHV